MASTSTTPTPMRPSNKGSDGSLKRSLDHSKGHSDAASTMSTAPSEPYTPKGTLRSIGIVSACTLSMMMNIAIGNPAITLTSVGEDFDETEASTQWVINAYAISAACFLLLSGRLADLYGRKRVWMIGFAILAIFDIGCGFANDAMTLYILRGFQGLGGAAVVPASLGILAHSFPPSRARSLAFATFSAGAPMGGAIGFMLGAVVTQLSGPTWRTLYFVTAGASALGIILGFLCIDADVPSHEKDRRVDWIGALLVTSGLVLIVFVLSDSPSAAQGWKTPYIIALFVVGGLLIVAFAFWQWYLEKRLDDPSSPMTRWAAPPLMRISMWERAKGRFFLMQIIACMNWASFTCWLVWVQLYYQDYLELTPILTMVRILPITFVGIAANVIIALVIGRVDVQWIVTTGTLLTGVAVLLFAVIDPALPYWAYGFPSALIIVLGADFVFASGTLFVAKVTPPHEQSVAGAVFQSMTQIGTAIGLSVSTIVYNAVLENGTKNAGITLDANTDNAPKDVQLRAYHDAMWVGFGFSMFCTALSIFLRGVGIVGHPPEKKPDNSIEAQQEATLHEKEPEDKSPIEKKSSSRFEPEERTPVDGPASAQDKTQSREDIA